MDTITVGLNAKKQQQYLILKMANRHGLIAGATGTGKTVTLQRLAEQFAKQGIPVFTADVKGDLAGLSLPGLNKPNIQEIFKKFSMRVTPAACPVIFWDLYGKNGHPLRTTISEIGPLLLGRLLNANEIQQGILDAAFNLANDKNILLLDIKDIRTLLAYMGEHSEALQSAYGNISKNTVGVLQRGLLSLSTAGGDQFFGEPQFDLNDFMQRDQEGHGYVNILDATTLIQDPRLYCTFLLWLLTALFEQLPEVGDVEKPKLIFFFDEAHLLFDAAPKVLLDKIEQVVRLIRSKGIGVYFITQSPLDIPEDVLGQLGNRIQHALRAFTPKDQKAVKAAAQTFRQNPHLDTTTAITQLGVGEALTSFLDEEGVPAIVEKIQIIPPVSRIGTITPIEREALLKASPYYGKYEQAIDRTSAFEKLKDAERPTYPPQRKPSRDKKPPPSTTDTIIKSTESILKSSLGKQIIRTILGSVFGKKK